MNRILSIIVSQFLLCLMTVTGQQPNVLLIVSDDLNTRIGPYMEIRKHTPNLDRLAAEGVRFTRTYCQYPLCGPSRASFMSGLYSETNGILGNNDQPGSYRKENPALSDHPSMAGFFREQGYFSARVSKIFHMGVPGGIERGDPGGDEPDSWDYTYNVMGPETQSDGELELLSPGNLHYGSNFSRMLLDNGLRYTQTDYMAVSQAIAILENRNGDLPPGGTNKQKKKPDAPFFLAVGLVRPHVPFVAPRDCYKPYPDQAMQLPPVVIGDNVPPPALDRRNMHYWKMNEIQQKQVISGYMASVRFMDQQVGRLLDALDRLDVRKNTIVVFISDHGYNLGEHDCWSKVSLWEGSVRIPMIISDPAEPAQHGKSCSAITELLDLYPTLAGLCGLSGKQPKILQGHSLVPFITGKGNPGKVSGEIPDGERVAYTTTRRGKASTIRTERWRYTRWSEEALPGMEELYDHTNDPEEYRNLVTSPEYQDKLMELRTLFETTRERARNISR